MTTTTRRAMLGATLCAAPALASAAASPAEADPVLALVERWLEASRAVSARWGDQLNVDYSDALHQAEAAAWEPLLSTPATSPAGLLALLKVWWTVHGWAVPQEASDDPEFRLMAMITESAAALLPPDQRPAAAEALKPYLRDVL